MLIDSIAARSSKLEARSSTARRLKILLWLFLSASPVASFADSSLVRLDLLAALDAPLAGIDTAEIVFRDSEDAAKKTSSKGTVILCPGQNGDGARLLTDGKWLEWGDKHDLSVVALRLMSDSDLLLGGAGYYESNSLLNTLILHGLESLGYPREPLYLYGFSGGARFISAFLSEESGRVGGFCAQAAQVWPKGEIFEGGGAPHGIVACGELDGPRLTPTMAFLQRGREAGNPWLWIMLPRAGHSRSNDLEQFTRAYFACLASDTSSETRIDHSRFELLTETDSPPLSLTSILPCKDLFTSWLSLHSR